MTEHIKQQIEDKYHEDSQYWQESRDAAEYGYSLGEQEITDMRLSYKSLSDQLEFLAEKIINKDKEITRLKELIEKAHTKGWLDFPKDDFQAQHINIESSWQQFQTDNNL